MVPRAREHTRSCTNESPCAWDREALDRAIVSYLLLIHDLGLERAAGAAPAGRGHHKRAST